MFRKFLFAFLFGALLPAGYAQGANVSVAAFYGKFSGSGFAENADSLYFGTTVRDLDVTIGPSANGFFVEWTTIIHAGGNPAKPDVRRKTQSVEFTPTNNAGVFRGIGSGDLLDGEPYIWANVLQQTLTIYIMNVETDGTYNLQSYARKLSGYGMDLVFRRIRDGEPVREARAKLSKVAN